MSLTCWFCRQPIQNGESANRLPQGSIAVHTACLRQDAALDGARPGDDLTDVA